MFCIFGNTVFKYVLIRGDNTLQINLLSQFWLFELGFGGITGITTLLGGSWIPRDKDHMECKVFRGARF